MSASFLYMDDILSHWAAKTPDATAVRWPGGSLSYADLDARATRLAEALGNLGAGPDTRVGVYMEKSQDSIVAAYGVLRSKAAYVPLDPTAPPARLNSIISSCGIEIAVADPSKIDALGDLGVSCACDSSGAMLKDEGPAVHPVNARSIMPNDPAYILYTSGTTGVPKGIVHTHKSGLAYVAMTSSLCALSATDRVAHHTPLHFDMSIFDIFSSHSVGACTVVLPAMYTKMPASLSKLTEAEQITVWYSVPFALTQMAERGALDDRNLSALRIVMFAGESILPGALKRFADFVPDATFINAYGPAEINGCTSKSYQHGDLDGETPIGIGFANDGIATLVTPEGELLVAGDQLMQGYWNDPARNDATLRVVEDADGVARRYYATGDVVRMLGNGELELVGRIDRQVKIRGYRVELDEVELAVASSPAVSETAVVFCAERGTLTAFVSLRPDVSASEQDLRAACAASLPPYAVPAEFVVMPSLYRTSTGKIDRLKLAEMLNG